MLKTRRIERKRKLAKYMKKVLKHKHGKAQQFDIVVKEEHQQPIEAQLFQLKEQNDHEGAAWQDSDDQNAVDLEQTNMLKKLRKDDSQVSQKELQNRLRAYKATKSPKEYESWAQGGSGQDEKEYEDILHEQLLENNLNSKQITINYVGKCQKRHNSIVTGVEWHNKVVFTTGLDKTLRIWTFDESKPEFNKELELQKTVYVQNLPLTSCSSMNEKIYMGTIRRNYAVFDLNKNYTNLITSAYLSKHTSYRNLKAGNGYVGLASGNCLSILNGNNQFIGQLWSNEPINDFSFGQNNEVVGVSKEAIYLWDIRKMKARQVLREGLNFTSVRVSRHNPMISVGSQSGVVYLYRKSDQIGQIYKEIDNLVTSVSGLSESLDGNLLVSYSKWKRNALKVIVTQDCSVLSSWPGINTKLNYPTALNFSANTAYLAVGSANGNLSMYNIQSGRTPN